MQNPALQGKLPVLFRQREDCERAARLEGGREWGERREGEGREEAGREGGRGEEGQPDRRRREAWALFNTSQL